MINRIMHTGIVCKNSLFMKSHGNPCNVFRSRLNYRPLPFLKPWCYWSNKVIHSSWLLVNHTSTIKAQWEGTKTKYNMKYIIIFFPSSFKSSACKSWHSTPSNPKISYFTLIMSRTLGEFYCCFFISQSLFYWNYSRAAKAGLRTGTEEEQKKRDGEEQKKEEWGSKNPAAHSINPVSRGLWVRVWVCAYVCVCVSWQ